MDKKKIISTILLFVAAIIWGSAFVAQSVGMDSIGPYMFNVVRNIVSGLALIPVIFILDKMNIKSNKKKKEYTRKQLLTAGIITGTALFFGSALQQVGIQYTTTAKSGFITALYIVLVPVLSLFLGKKNKPKIWLCVALATVGFYFLSIKSGFTINKGDLLTLAAALSFSVHILTVDHFIPIVDGVRMSCIQFFIAGIISIVPAVIFETFEISAVQAAIIPILYTGLLSGAVGYTFQIVSQEHVEPAIASLILSLESVFAALAGWLILNQTLTPRELFGCAIVFAAILYAQAPEKRKSKLKDA